MENRRYMGPTQTKMKFIQQFLVKAPSNKFHWYSPSSSGTEICGVKDAQPVPHAFTYMLHAKTSKIHINFNGENYGNDAMIDTNSDSLPATLPKDTSYVAEVVRLNSNCS